MSRIAIVTGLFLMTAVPAFSQNSGCSSVSSDQPLAGTDCAPSIGFNSTLAPSPTIGEFQSLSVPDDPLGLATRSAVSPSAGDLIDNQPTSSIPEVGAPAGMAPLTVPNDPLGTATRSEAPSGTGTIGTTTGNTGISLPPIN